MASRKRTWTDYPGVFFVEVPRKGSSGTEKVYYIMYRRDGKQVEEKAGHQYKDDMTPARASRLRGERMEGGQSNEERREAKRAEAHKPTINRLWAIYGEATADKATHRDDGYRHNKYISPAFGEKTPEQMTTTDLDKFRDRLLKTLSPQTVKHVLAQIRRVLNHAVKKRIIPAPSHLQFELPSVDNQKTETMTPLQMKLFLDSLDNEADQDAVAAVKVALLTGMRKSAVLALRWADLDFDTGFILLGGTEAKSGKTTRIPMGAARAVFAGLDKRGEYLFPGKEPGAHRTTVMRVARRARDAAGLPADWRPMHGLRHSFASVLASSGKVDLYTLQRLLTHESPAMTARYAHLADEAMQRAASVMAEVLAGKDK